MKDTYKFIKPFIKPHIPKFITASLCMAGFALTTAISSWLLKPTLDGVFIKGDMRTFYLVLLAIPTVYLFRGVFWYFQTYLTSLIGQDIGRRIREECFEHLQILSLDYHHRDSVGKSIGILTDQVASLQYAVSRIPLTLIAHGLTFIALLFLLIYLNWKLALIGLAVLPFASYLISNFSRKLKFLSERIQSQTLSLYSKLQEKLSGIMVIKLYNREEDEIRDFNILNKDLFKLMLKLQRIDSISSPLMEFIGAIGVVLLLYLGGHDVLAGRWTTGSFCAFIMALFSFYRPLREFAQLNSYIQLTNVATRNIVELLSRRPSVTERAAVKDIDKFENELSFDNVSFIYPQTNEVVLRNVSFTIKKGENLAIIGPSGAGKTSLVYLLLKFFSPVSGRILLDGTNLEEISSRSLRRLIGVVPQDVFLFNDTIYNNIAYGGNNDESEVIEAAKLANAYDFITKLPEGFQTKVGERGAILSGGQKQRISIARTLLRKPSILILDEATSALDPESELLIQEAIQRLMRMMTVIIITHRLASIKWVSRLIVIDNGKIVEDGPPQELLRSDGLYKKFHQLQFT